MELNDDVIPQVLLDLERSYSQIEYSVESFARVFDTYCCMREMLSQQTLSQESLENHYIPAFQLAFAGTSISFEAEDYSAESVLETVKKIGKAVLDAIKRFFTMMMDALSNIDIAATWMNQHINLLERKRLTSVGKTPTKPTVTLGRQHRYLRVGRIFAAEPVKLLSELRRLSDVVEVINNDYAPGLVRGTSAMSSIGNSVSGDKLTTALIASVEQIGFTKIASKLKMTSADQGRFGRSGVMATPPLLGGQSVFFMQGNLVEKGTAALRFHGMLFTTTSREPYKLAETHEFKSLSPADIVGVPDILRKLVNQCSKGSSDGVSKHMRRLRSDLEKLVDSKMSDAQVSEPDLAKIRSAANAYMYWTRSVTLPLYGNAMSVIRTVLSYSQQSVKTWG